MRNSTIKGIVVYGIEEYERNHWFANEIISKFNERNISVELIVTDMEYISLEYVPDFAIIRVINPSLTTNLEKLGCICFNNSNVSKIFNDKFETYNLAKKHGIDYIPTILSDYFNLAGNINSNEDTVVKTLDGHGGKEVFLIKKGENVYEVIDKKLKNKLFCVQPRIGSYAKDLRVYVMGEKIYACVMRSSENDFRANFSLGGNICEYTPDENILNIAETLGKMLHADFIGIDFIFNDEDKPVLNEMEDVVGTRMLYQLTQKDVVKDYVEYIINKITNKRP